MKMEEISKAEEQEIIDVVKKVWTSVKARCSAQNFSDDETASALYTIQDFLTNLDCNEDGVNP